MVKSLFVTVTPRAEPKPPVGVIESLATGFEAIASHIWIVLLPLGLDLFLWLGPRLSISPLTQNLIKWMKQLQGPAEAEAQSLQTTLMAALELAGKQVNVFNFLSTAPLGIPVLMDWQLAEKIPGGQPVVLAIDNSLSFVILWLGFSILGLLLSTVYFVFIGLLFDENKLLSLREIGKRMLVNWGRLTALSLILAGLSVLVLPAFIFVFGVLQMMLAAFSALTPFTIDISGTASVLSQVIIGVILLWILMLLVFSVHGMVLKNRGVFGAMWDSVQLVHWNLLSVIGLFILIYLIGAGLDYLWNLPAPDSWMLLLGIGGHAFVSTGLVAATFVFYKDRYRWWTEMREWFIRRSKASSGK